jgi:hypothetical protein
VSNLTPHSVVQLAQLLREVISKRNFSAHPHLTQDVLRSQGALARLQLTDLGIIASSLNTLKSNANSRLPGGFGELDDIRKMALEYRIQFDASFPDVSGRTKAGLQRRVDELETTVKRLEEDLFYISQAFSAAIRKARVLIAEANRGDLNRRWTDEELGLFAQASQVRTTVKRVS